MNRFASRLPRLAGLLAVSMATVLGTAVAIAQTAPERPFAAPTTMTSAAPSGIASLGQVTVALGLVLAVIFVAAWLLRRVRGLGRTGTGILDVIADMPVGQKERAVLIRVGKTQVLLGVAPGRVTTLHVLAEPVEIAPQGSGNAGGGGINAGSGTNVGGSMSATGRPDFKSLLLKSLGKS